MNVNCYWGLWIFWVDYVLFLVGNVFCDDVVVIGFNLCRDC